MSFLGKYKFKALKQSTRVLDKLFSSSRVNLYSVLRRMVDLASGVHTYHILSMDDYASISGSIFYTLKAGRKGYAVTCLNNIDDYESKIMEFPLPDIKLYCYNNVVIHGSSDMVLDPYRHLAVNDYCANKNDEHKGYNDNMLISMYGHTIQFRYSSISKEIPCGIMISGKFSTNYYHNLLENLLRLLILEENDNRIPSEVPIIIDEAVLHIASLSRIFEILTDNTSREIVVLGGRNLLKVGSLYCISPINHFVPVYNSYSTYNDSDYLFDKEYVIKLKDRLIVNKSNRSFPKRLFISRSSTKRRNFNEDELFELLQPLGFEKVAPEEYSFEEQMSMFNSADFIIGGSGAALTNLLFCHEGCHIICITKNLPIIIPDFSPIAFFNNSKMYYYESKNEKTDYTPHANFNIDVNDFSMFVNEYIKPML